jgi:hypothetical protein
VALRRGHGPGGDALRALVLELTADEQPLRRLGALMAGTDVGGSRSDLHPLVGTLVTDRVLHVDHEDSRLAGLLGSGRAALLDLAARADLRASASAWGDRLEVVRVTVDDRPADALLVLPDTRVAWAAPVGATGAAHSSLQSALATWFGAPRG